MICCVMLILIIPIVRTFITSFWDAALYGADDLNPLDFPGVLVHRHAPFTWGTTVAHAVEAAVALECIAHLALMSLRLAPKLKPVEPELLQKHFGRKHGPKAYYGQR